ncbi:MAG: phosphoglucosamine mutase, partial [Betaproteobacteria bacterium]|nr:phosphoglucosamine mutase [Betaproteobacteria bacterium]
WQLGGENSGHIVCLDKHTTGDGIISALQVLTALRETGATLARAAQAVTLYPQVLVNVRVDRRSEVSGRRAVKEAVAAAEAALGARSRVLLRASGTEPVVRVMVEGKSRPAVKRWAAAIAAAVRKTAAAPGSQSGHQAS